jgi:hypothetical protein
MVRELHTRPGFADRFLSHMLTRNIRIEEDLIDQLFNSSEKRLARTLLLRRVTVNPKPRIGRFRECRRRRSPRWWGRPVRA